MLIGRLKKAPVYTDPILDRIQALEYLNAKLAEREKDMIEYVKDQKKKSVEVEKEKIVLVDRDEREIDKALLESQSL